MQFDGRRISLAVALATVSMAVGVPIATGAPGQVTPDAEVTPYGSGPESKDPPSNASSNLPEAPAGESDAPAPAVGDVNFLAVKGGTGVDSESGFIPPDTTGDVGSTRIIVPLNGRIKIFDKAGAQLYSAELNDFFSTPLTGTVVPNTNAFDPRVQYDRLSGRWFVTAINGGDNNRIMIATSSGPSPSGEADFDFEFFNHDEHNPSFGDYATLGVDANAVYLGTNDFGPGYLGSSLYVLDKADLIAGTVTKTGFDVGTPTTGMFAPHVAENDDPNATVGYLVGIDNGFFGSIVFRRVLDPGGTPTLSPAQSVAVPPTSLSCNVPAMGTAGTTELGMDGLNDRLYESMVEKDPATGEDRLWTAHNLTVDASGTAIPAASNLACSGAQRLASRFYELGSLGGTPSLVQSGTLFDSAASNPDSFWMPSIAANGQGHALMGTSIAGPLRFAGVALTQRFAGEPAGALSPFIVPQGGAAAYNVQFSGTRNRWGDYSMTTVDPNDDMTFWTFQEYVTTTDQWGVRVIKVKAPPPATPSSAGDVRPGLASTSVTVTGTSTDGSGFYDPGPDTGGPGFANHISATVSNGVTVNGITVNSPTSLTLDLNTSAATDGNASVTIANPDGQSAVGTGILEVDGTPPQTTINSGPAEGATIATATATFGFSSNEPGSTFECKLDAGAFAPCNSGSLTTPSLADGAHTFSVRATDPLGNQDTSAAVRNFNVAVDSDGDGVPDASDNCPNAAGTVGGCPDADGDGVPDASDNCPNAAGTVGGCPDADGDGVPDASDNCPNAAGTAGGCPDADGDGVPDASDNCPNAAGATANGCPDVARTLTLSYNEAKDKFKGKLGPAGDCAAGQKVAIFRKKKGRDPKVTGARTKPSGKFKKVKDVADGKYYAKVKPKTVPSAGNCLRKKSKRVRVG